MPLVCITLKALVNFRPGLRFSNPLGSSKHFLGRNSRSATCLLRTAAQPLWGVRVLAILHSQELPKRSPWADLSNAFSVLIQFLLDQF